MTALTYVITHPSFRAVKVGHTTPTATRLQDFFRRGWEPYRSLEVVTPALARQVEQMALFEIRHSLHIPPYLTRSEMRECGWTETSSLGLIAASEVWDIVCHQAVLVQLSAHVSGPADGRRRNGGTPPLRVSGDCLPNSRMARTQARLEQTALQPTQKDTQ
jgi:hypothetical protein